MPALGRLQISKQWTGSGQYLVLFGQSHISLSLKGTTAYSLAETWCTPLRKVFLPCLFFETDFAIEAIGLLGMTGAETTTYLRQVK